MTTFNETQKINQWWIWLILIAILGIWGWGVIDQIVLGHSFGDKPMSNTGLLFSGIIPLSITAFFVLLQLQTKVGDKGIQVHYFPIWKTSLQWRQIKQAQIIKYGFVGYGVRFSGKYGTVYNAKGNVGLLIQKMDGSKLLLGTQHPEELQSVVDQYLQHTS